MTKRTEVIRAGEQSQIQIINGEWQCICGNTASANGFYPCTITGEYLSEDAYPRNEAYLKCDACNHVIERESGKVLPDKTTPEHILIAAGDLCNYCAPNILAEMVDDWSHSEDTLELAQIALMAGISNCGLKALAGYINGKDRSIVVDSWILRGLKIPIVDQKLV